MEVLGYLFTEECKWTPEAQQLHLGTWEYKALFMNPDPDPDRNPEPLVLTLALSLTQELCWESTPAPLLDRRHRCRRRS